MLKMLIYLVSTGNCCIFVSVKEVLNQEPYIYRQKNMVLLSQATPYITQNQMSNKPELNNNK